MGREQETQFEQDNLGNERRKLDRLRAQEGSEGATSEDGIRSVGSSDVGTQTNVYSPPSHADHYYLTEVKAYNGDSINSDYSLYEGDNDGNGSISNATRRTVPTHVNSSTTDVREYDGAKFEGTLAVDSGFEGFIGVGVVVDHKESSE